MNPRPLSCRGFVASQARSLVMWVALPCDTMYASVVAPLRDSRCQCSFGILGVSPEMLSDLNLSHGVLSFHGWVLGLKLRQTCAWPLVLKMPEFDFSQVVAFRKSFLTFRMAPEARTDACLPNHYPPRARVHSLVHSLGRRLFFLSLEKREQRIT